MMMVLSSGMGSIVFAEEGSSGQDVWDGFSTEVGWYDASKTEFHLSTAAELAGLSAISNGIARDASGQEIPVDDFTGKTIFLDADIWLNDHLSSGKDTTAHEWTPVTGVFYIDQGKCTPFNGTLDGQGHTICNIYEYQGGTYSQSTGLSERGVALIGYAAEGARVRNLSLTGYLYGNRYVGGFIGKTGTKAMSFDDSIGPGATVENCTNYADITSTGFRGSGGIVGAAWNNGRIFHCVNYGTITGLGTDKQGTPGGITGESEGIIRGCANYGSVTNILTTNKANTGGIVGNTTGAGLTEGCINYGDVTGGTAGGISGYECSLLKNCLNLGSVTGRYNEGSVIGEMSTSRNPSSVFYLPDTAQKGIGKVARGTDTTQAVNREALQSEEFLLQIGKYNGTGPTEEGSGYFVRGEDGFPQLWEAGNPGTGETGPVLTIANANDLRRFSESISGGTDYTGLTVRLLADIDLAPGVVLPADADTEDPANRGAAGDSVEPDGSSFDHGSGSNDRAGSGAPTGGETGEAVWYTLQETYYEDGNSASPSWYSGTFPRPVFTEQAEFWIPAGSPEHPFTGAFEGDGHTIRGLCTEESGSYHGFFGYLGSGAAVRNLKIGAGALAGHSFVGGIAGFADGALVENCSSEAVIFASGGAEPGNSGIERAGYAGGILGGAAGSGTQSFTVTGCSNAGLIVCPNCFHGGRAAGIIGIVDSEEDSGTVRNCRNDGKVRTFQYGGGIVGLQWSQKVLIDACLNTADISGSSPSKAYIGGIAGLCNGPVSNCYNTGNQISTATGNGGLPTRYAGIVGQSASGITNCYDIGTRTYSYWEGIGTSGPIVGDAQGSAPVNCCSLDSGFGTETLTPVALKQAASRLGSAFAEDTDGINQGYPVLQWQKDANYRPEYPVTVRPAPGASVRISQETAKTDETVRIRVSELADNRDVAEIRVTDGNGRTVPVKQEEGERTYSFTMPDRSVTVAVILRSTAAPGAARVMTVVRPDNIWSVDLESETAVWKAGSDGEGQEVPVNENDACHLTEEAGTIRAGDLVLVKVSRMAGAYQSGLKGITVSGVPEEAIAVISEVRDTYNGYVMEGLYSFLMPDRDVELGLQVEHQAFTVMVQEGEDAAPETKLTMSREDMEALAEASTMYYGGYDSAPYSVVGIAKKAVKFASVMDAAGLKAEPGDTLKLKGTDGYERIMTYEELFGEPRYYFPAISAQGGDREAGVRELDPMFVIVGYQSRETGDDSGRSSLADNQTIDDKIADTLNTYRFVYGQTQEQFERKQNTIGRMPKHVYQLTVVKNRSTSPEDPSAEPSFQTHSLLLSGRIGLNFYMDLPEREGLDYTESYMEFTVCDNTQKVALDRNRKNESGELVGFTCPVNSVQMADAVTAVFHYVDGAVEKTVRETYSVADYVERFRARASEYDDRTVELVHALADYGHYIQPFLAETRGWKIGDAHQEMPGVRQYTEADVQAAADAVKDCTILRNSDGSGIEKITFSLYLDSDTSLYFYLQPEAAFDGTLQAYLRDSDGEITVKKTGDGRYRVAVPGIPAHKLGTDYTVAVTAGGAFALRASAMSYVNALLHAEAYRNNLPARYAMTALYHYCQAAAAYR